MITVQIRTADGLFPSRLLQIHWYRISEYPQHAAAVLNLPLKGGGRSRSDRVGVINDATPTPTLPLAGGGSAPRLRRFKPLDPSVKFIDLTARQNMLGRRRNVPA